MNIQQFLNANPVDNITEEVVISPRFKDEKGELLKFTIKAMMPNEFEEIRKRATQILKNKQVHDTSSSCVKLDSKISNIIT
jgi:hypothetical protein